MIFHEIHTTLPLQSDMAEEETSQPGIAPAGTISSLFSIVACADSN